MTEEELRKIESFPLLPKCVPELVAEVRRQKEYISGLKAVLKHVHERAADLAEMTEVSEERRELLLFRRITSEIPVGPRLVAEPGTYGADRISLNEHGAVSVLAVSAGGTTGWLGVKPGEFRWLEAGE